MQKPSVLSFLTTLLLVAAVCTNGEEVVKDTNGDPLYFGDRYLIQPVDNIGGLVPARTPFFFPLLAIIQSSNEQGLPVSFSAIPPIPTPQPGCIPPGCIPRPKFEITSMRGLAIEFRSNIWPGSNEFSKYWQVDVSVPANKDPSILTGGDVHAENTLFAIEKAGEEAGENIYKFTTANGTVGSRLDALLRAYKLFLSRDNTYTLHVKFSKVSDAPKATTSTAWFEKLGLRMFPFY